MVISWLEKHYKIPLLTVIFIGAVIFYASSLSFENLPANATSGWKSIAYHLFIFFIFGFFILVCFIKGQRIKFLFFGIIISMVYGALDEMHQFFVPNRVCSFSDFLIDTFGILAASFAYLLTILLRKNRIIKFKTN